ncbi:MULTISPECIES: DMT family transporter [Marivita]|jgi:drug/metabolite transporter (DMT)-like permease|uniref:DMT family transporter n=1 Tax=Marivita cryptomonadis TaxID=505252 RepID=A0A9Q2RZY4_9RHOB|nr:MULTISPECIES: DMT family transporter [Marivita]MCR9167610.1 DMT family transporter [Paracoccaceae bacterium]MBM2321991.1 DMT family transporter [Marivita cryptomonadis]MBM2331382.1 DMT family transporter [Marivita cryptomonadis]MBM2340968.1 DMT family transporter [Marivita cryptomonadis]MBM2345630.1 DMT family transporter [Marivita cryptomonadis]
MSSNVKGAVLALIAFGLYSTHDVFIKILGASYSPIQIVFFSVLLSFPLATIMLMRDATPGTLVPVHPWWMAVRTLAAVVTGVSAFYAFSVLPLTQTYAILFATPLIITVLSIPILGETVRLRRWMAVIVGLIGVMVVLRPGSTELNLGHLAAILAAFGGAFASIVVRKIGAEERTVVMLLYPMVANFVLMGLALAFVYKPMPIEHIGMLAVISILAWIAGRIIISAYRTGEAAIVAPMQYSQILWATGFGLLFFGETTDIYTAAGATIIISSGIYIVFRESRGGTSRTTPVLRTRTRFATPSMPRLGDMMRSGRFRDEPMNRGGRE